MKRLALLLLALASATHAADWPRFRGPAGSGVAPGATLPTSLTKANTHFSIDLPGVGHGSPAVHGNRLFLLAADPDTFERIPLCLDAITSKPLWQHRLESARFKGHRFNSPASSTPAVDSERVYFTWATTKNLTVAAYTHDGTPAWSRELGPVKGGHGFAASPSLHGDLLVLNRDQEKGGGDLLALNSKTGETVWSVPRKSTRLSYSTPVPISVGDNTFLVVTNWQHGFTTIDPGSGKVLGELSTFDTSTPERAISSPIAYRDLIIGTCGFTSNPKHCVAVRVATDGTLTEIWRIEKSVPHIPSPIVVNDLLFLWDDKGLVTCADPLTGKTHYRERVKTKGACFGSPVSDGKTIFCADENGQVHAIAAKKQFDYLASSDLGELTRTTPAIAHDTLYVRTHTHLHAFR